MSVGDPSEGSTGYGPTRYGKLQFNGDETKFEMWETRFLGHMELKDLKETISPSPPTNGGTVAEPDAVKNSRAYSELIQFLDDTSLGLVMRDAPGDGRKALDILRTHYAGKGKTRVVTLWIEFATVEKLPSETSTSYILRVEKISTSLKNAGETISDSTLVAMSMKGLTEPVYGPFVHLMKMQNEESFASFKTKLRNFEDTERCRGNLLGEDEKVMKANSKFYNKNNNRNNNMNSGGSNGGGGGSGGSSGGVKCFTCGNPGHKSRNCPSKQQKKGKWCGICNNKSHNEASCRKKDNANKVENNQQTHSFQFKVSVVEETSRSVDKVELSSKSIEETVMPKVECEPKLTSEVECEEILTLVKDSNEPDETMENQVFTFDDDDQIKVVSTVESVHAVTDEMLVDSGASAHICTDPNRFINIDPTFQPHMHSVELADGTKMSNLAEHRGDIQVSMKDNSGNFVNSTLKNALYIPSFPVDIFSVPSATEKGHSVIFKKNDSKIITGSGTTFDVKQKGKLFFVDRIKSVKSVKKDNSLSTWHRIMGHCNKDDVIKLENIVDGMKIENKDNFQCEICILGKQQNTRNRTPDERAKACMELVHTDLVGPINPVAREGFRYAISFVDDYSSATFIYFLKKKSDSAKALLKFLADSRPYGPVKLLRVDPNSSPVQRVRSDNGGEFICKEFTDVLLQNKIKHERSAPYSPHQNGTVERGWRTLFDMARCLLLEGKLPRNLWTYAIMAAVSSTY